jgi:hypothetical protein
MENDCVIAVELVTASLSESVALTGRKITDWAD